MLSLNHPSSLSGLGPGRTAHEQGTCASQLLPRPRLLARPTPAASAPVVAFSHPLWALLGTGLLSQGTLFCLCQQPCPGHRKNPGRGSGRQRAKGDSLSGHQERKGEGTLRGVQWAKRTPPLQVAFLWCHPPSPPKLRASSCALDRASRCHPHSGHSHSLSCGGSDTSPAHRPGPTSSCRGRGHTALFAAMSPPAISQGRAQCPLYMRLHEGSAGALLSLQTPK